MKKSTLLFIALLFSLYSFAQDIITLEPGWTWFSYLYNEPLSVGDAFSPISPEIGDVVKSQHAGYAVFTAEGWSGSLTALSMKQPYHYFSCKDHPVSFSIADPTPPSPSVPEGAIGGLFSVNLNGRKVYFAQGNLQYRASTDTWRFAEHQWDHVGNGNDNISPSNSGWIDLFGWGTSGYHDNADACNTRYEPWSVDYSVVDDTYNYYGYGPSTNMICTDLLSLCAKYDWGLYNTISNGDSQAFPWHTLTDSEWAFVFNTRSTTSGIRYAKATVNNVNGVVIVPDDWSTDTYTLNNTNTYDAPFSNNIISQSTWEGTLEPAGCVFLPAAGYRIGASTMHVGDDGNYWSTVHRDHKCAYSMLFSGNYLSPNYANERGYGLSVRLVQVGQENIPSVLTGEASVVSSTSATCSYHVRPDGGPQITAHGVCWSTSHNPTIADSHTDDGIGVGDFTSLLTGLTPNTTYYYRAYATNGYNLAYGSENYFTTQSAPECP